MEEFFLSLISQYLQLDIYGANIYDFLFNQLVVTQFTQTESRKIYSNKIEEKKIQKNSRNKIKVNNYVKNIFIIATINKLEKKKNREEKFSKFHFTENISFLFVMFEMAKSNSIPKLYNILSVKDIDNIQIYFNNTNGLTYDDFRDFLARFELEGFDEDDFMNLCLKIDMDRDCRIKFNEFIAFFITELQNDDNAAERLSIMPPIVKSTKITSTMMQRSNIVRGFYVAGFYITFGSYGDVYYWSPKWKLERIIHVGELQFDF